MVRPCCPRITLVTTLPWVCWGNMPQVRNCVVGVTASISSHLVSEPFSWLTFGCTSMRRQGGKLESSSPETWSVILVSSWAQRDCAKKTGCRLHRHVAMLPEPGKATPSAAQKQVGHVALQLSVILPT